MTEQATAGVKRYVARKRMTTEALEWTGENVDEMKAFAGARFHQSGETTWLHSIHGMVQLLPGEFVARSASGSVARYTAADFARDFELKEDAG